MPRLLPLVLSMLALAGCGQDAPGARPSSGPRTQAPAAGMEFRGRRPCVDCAGIDAWLRLEQEGSVRRYTLVERYLGDGGERRFEERGDWTSEGDLLRLRSDEGGLRVHARLPGRGLQARASDGGPLAAVSDDVMSPVAFGDGQ